MSMCKDDKSLFINIQVNFLLSHIAEIIFMIVKKNYILKYSHFCYRVINTIIP